MGNKNGRPKVHPLLRKEVKPIRFEQWMINDMNKLKGNPSDIVRDSVAKANKLKPPTKKQLKEYKED